jgi:hypothetical protein
MIYPFNAAFRSLVGQRFAAFTRIPALDTHGLKRAAVAVTLVESRFRSEAEISSGRSQNRIYERTP